MQSGDRGEGRFVARRSLEYAGRELSGYQAPLVVPAPGQAIDSDELWQAIQVAAGNECDKALLRYLPASSAPSWARPMGEPTPVLDLRPIASFDDLLSRCSANHRGDVKRRFRRLRERASRTDGESLDPGQDYIRELNEAYQHFFFHYSATPLLVVETSHLDLSGSDEALDDLIRQINGMGRGTQYYVPRT